MRSQEINAVDNFSMVKILKNKPQMYSGEELCMEKFSEKS